MSDILPDLICDTSAIQYLYQLELDRLQALRFRLAPGTRQTILKLAGE